MKVLVVVVVVVISVINILVITTQASSVAKCSRHENQPPVELETTSGMSILDFLSIGKTLKRFLAKYLYKHFFFYNF